MNSRETVPEICQSPEENNLDFLREDNQGHRHSICVGKKCAYCMDCGQILLEYKSKKAFYKLINPSMGDVVG